MEERIMIEEFGFGVRTSHPYNEALKILIKVHKFNKLKAIVVEVQVRLECVAEALVSI